MICGLEAITKRNETIKEMLIKEAREEEERLLAEQRRIAEEQKVAFLVCERVIAPLLEKACKFTTKNLTWWGEITVEKNSNGTSARLMEDTMSDYADGRLSYRATRDYLQKGETEVDFPYFNLKTLREILNSYCWDFDIVPTKEWKKYWGKITLYNIRFKPIPSCI